MVIDILELLDKDFKETMIKMLQQTIADMLETNEKIEYSEEKQKVSEGIVDKRKT